MGVLYEKDVLNDSAVVVTFLDPAKPEVAVVGVAYYPPNATPGATTLLLETTRQQADLLTYLMGENPARVEALLNKLDPKLTKAYSAASITGVARSEESFTFPTR